MNANFEITSSKKLIEGIGDCVVYGIRYTDCINETAVIEDISPDKAYVTALGKRLSANELYAIHLYDAVFDAISLSPY